MFYSNETPEEKKRRIQSDALHSIKNALGNSFASVETKVKVINDNFCLTDMSMDTLEELIESYAKGINVNNEENLRPLNELFLECERNCVDYSGLKIKTKALKEILSNRLSEAFKIIAPYIDEYAKTPSNLFSIYNKKEYDVNVIYKAKGEEMVNLCLSEGFPTQDSAVDFFASTFSDGRMGSGMMLLRAGEPLVRKESGRTKGVMISLALAYDVNEDEGRDLIVERIVEDKEYAADFLNTIEAQNKNGQEAIISMVKERMLYDNWIGNVASPKKPGHRF